MPIIHDRRLPEGVAIVILKTEVKVRVAITKSIKVVVTKLVLGDIRYYIII